MNKASGPQGFDDATKRLSAPATPTAVGEDPEVRAAREQLKAAQERLQAAEQRSRGA